MSRVILLGAWIPNSATGTLCDENSKVKVPFLAKSAAEWGGRNVHDHMLFVEALFCCVGCTALTLQRNERGTIPKVTLYNEV